MKKLIFAVCFVSILSVFFLSGCDLFEEDLPEGNLSLECRPSSFTGYWSSTEGVWVWEYQLVLEETSGRSDIEILSIGWSRHDWETGTFMGDYYEHGDEFKEFFHVSDCRLGAGETLVVDLDIRYSRRVLTKTEYYVGGDDESGEYRQDYATFTAQ